MVGFFLLFKVLLKNLSRMHVVNVVIIQHNGDNFYVV